MKKQIVSIIYIIVIMIYIPELQASVSCGEKFEMPYNLQSLTPLKKLSGCKKEKFNINLTGLKNGFNYPYTIDIIYKETSGLTRLESGQIFGGVDLTSSVSAETMLNTFQNIDLNIIDSIHIELPENAIVKLSIKEEVNSKLLASLSTELLVDQRKIDPDESDDIVMSMSELKAEIATNAKEWVIEFETESHGKWETSWAVAFIQNNSESYFTKANVDDLGNTTNYTITKKGSNNDLSLVPAMFFTYVKNENKNEKLNRGWSLGLGLDSSSLTPFAGYNWTYYQNIGITVGAAVSERSVLLGQYKNIDHRIVNENLVDLTEDVYKPELFVALSYRFK